MKKIFFLFSLLSSFYSFGQCINLYIKEHLDGDPICRLKGNKLEMCFDNRQTISGGDCTFYIQSTRMNGDAQIYEFGLDKTTPYFYAPKYGELMINTATKKLGIQIDDNWGSYSYYNEAEMSKIQNQEKTDYENSKSKLEKQNSEQDILTTNRIQEALENKNYLKAFNLYQNLNKENNDLLGEINKYFLPIKSKLDGLYLDYLKEYQIAKKEYFQDPEKFINNNLEHIKEHQISLDGHAAYLKRINNTTDEENKKLRELFLKQNSFFYEKNNDKHLIAPVGLLANFYGNYGGIWYDNIKLSVKYDTLANCYFSKIDFYKNDTIYLEGIIINRREYNVKKYIMPYSKGFKELIDLVGGADNNNFVLNNYPKKEIQLDYIETLSFQKTNQEDVLYPELGTINDKWNELNKSFTKLNNKLGDYINYDPEIFSRKFYNPIFLYYIKELYPNSDSLVFVFADKNDKLDKINFMPINYDNIYKDEVAYIIPLKKNKVELKGKQIKIYQTNGNYELINVKNVITKSLISLSFDKESLKLDTSSFSASKRIRSTKEGGETVFFQSLFSFKQYKIGKPNPNGYGPSIIDAKDYRTNDKVIIQFLPIYETGGQGEDFRYMQRPVFDYITEYLNYKEKGNIKKASKSLSKVVKTIEGIKSTIQN